MARTGADLFVDTLEHYGVEYVFGNPGTTELPVMDALEDSQIDYRLALHEGVAVGMAAGYARVQQYHAAEDPGITPVGVVNLHVTPGLAHGLANIYEAGVSGVPLVVTAGEQAIDLLHEEPILSADLEAMTRQFTKWTAEVPSPDALPSMLRRAFRTALTPPTGPVFLALPLNAMLNETTEAPQRLGPIPDAGAGDPAAIEHVTEYLLDADDLVLIVGDLLAHASPRGVDGAVAFAEATGARVHGELFASEISFPTDHEQWVSFVPPVESIATQVFDTDTLVFAGCWSNNTTTTSALELIPDDATLLHVGPDPWELGKNHPVDAAVLGDPGRVLAAIATRVEDRLPADTHETRVSRAKQIRETTQRKLADIGVGDAGDGRASKAELVDALHTAAPDARIVDESITTRLVLLNRGTFNHTDYFSGKAGGLGYGLPAAIGAAIASDRPIVACIGDGSYLYYPHALYSAVRYGIDLTVVIPDNRNYRILKDNMLSLLGGTEDEYEFIGMDFDPPVDIPQNAESLGARGEFVDEPTRARLEAVITDAVGEPGPVVIDVPVED